MVGVEQDDGGYWMPLFVHLADDAELDDELRREDHRRHPQRRIAAPRARRHRRRAGHSPHHDRQAARDPDQANPVGRQARRCGVAERRRQARPARRIRGARPGVSVEAGDSSASGFPRIVRMLPTRFSRDPKATRTHREHRRRPAAGWPRSSRSCGRIRRGRRAIGRCWTRLSGSASATCTSS